MNIVLDTNILVASTISPNGAFYQIISQLQQQKYNLMLSVPLLFEYEDVLKRKDIQQLNQLNDEDVDVILNRFLNMVIR